MRVQPQLGKQTMTKLIYYASASMVWKWDQKWELTTQDGKRTQIPILSANSEGNAWQVTWQHFLGVVSQGLKPVYSLCPADLKHQ